MSRRGLLKEIYKKNISEEQGEDMIVRLCVLIKLQRYKTY
jgi:hypothetical protein